ncbi:hypothetical protein MROS_1509 [Melioribacter roseus P3M-2]|uniref:Secretion system C-terminal sorting domain-containing protein n=1 Tax=Melioribacter roseus (strain DSM 23840 / JCM 17771 / VKM B-2668 / P3M-2) TaxID=1191523 RepID=I7A4B0_MELRP|nr:kelch repeat-containing protein [Melioribacter roseus]AFN74746.1 hypothetical protein MROS_1509 [Melioribacter roseus P3M-2]
MKGKNYYLIIAINIALSTIIFPQKKFDKIGEVNWIQIDSMNEARFQHAIAVLPDGNILVSGGSGGEQGKPDKRSAEIYDFNTGKWRYTNPMNVPRSLHKLLPLKTGKVMAIGGYKERSCELFDPETETWTMTDSIPTLRATGYTVTELNDGRVLIAGGFRLTDDYKEMVYLNNCEIYDPNTGKWEIADSLNIPRWRHTAVLLNDGNVLIAGGSKKSALKECEIYNVTKNEWKYTTPMNEARTALASILLPNGNIFTSGGDSIGGTFPWKKSVEIFDVNAEKWSYAHNMLDFRADHKIYYLQHLDKLLIFGGAQLQGTEEDTWELYDPENLVPLTKGIFPLKNINYVSETDNSIQMQDGNIALIGGEEWDIISGLLARWPSRKCYIMNILTSVERNKNFIPKNFQLLQNYPNPFNPSTTIEYYLPKSGKVTIKIFDSLGKEIETLVNEHKQAGHYQVIFYARNLPSGVYYYSLISGSTIITKSMVLIK